MFRARILAVLVAATSILPSFGVARADPVVIDFAGFELVSSRRVSRTAFEYEYRPAVIGDQMDRQNVSVEVTSSGGSTEVVDGSAVFGAVQAGETVFSSDTIVLRQDRRSPFDPGVLSYAVDFDRPPIVLSYEFDDDNAVTVPIGREGGEVNLVSASGIGITMLVPADTVFEEQQFTLTPVDSVSGAPAFFTPVIAVGLGPAGQPFAAPPQITFEMPVGFRGDRLAIGFFTNDDGTEFYLTPLIGPDGKLADNEASLVTLSKSSFSGGGVALVDGPSPDGQQREISKAEQRAQDAISEISLEVQARQKSLPPGDPGGFFTEAEKFQLETILNDWNSDIERRLNLILLKIEAGAVTDADIEAVLALSGEALALEQTSQMLGTEGTVTTEILERLVAVMAEAFVDSFEDCATTDLTMITDSEEFRFKLIEFMQRVGQEGGAVFDAQGNFLFDSSDVDVNFILCRYQVELSPSFSLVDSDADAAVVEATVKPHNPVTGTLLPVVDGFPFAALGDFQIDSSDNVTLGIISENNLRFLVQGPDVGTVTLSGGRILSPVEASAQIGSVFSGEYTANFSGSTSNCTDPEDNGPGSGSLTVNLTATKTAVFNETVTHSLTGGGGGVSLDLTLIQTIGEELAPVNGTARFTETEIDTIVVDEQELVCRFDTVATGDLGGTATISSDSITIGLTASGASSDITGTPGACGSGSCRVEGTVTLTK